MSKSDISGSITVKTLGGVACPFCPLLCDDLVISSDGIELRTLKNACNKSTTAFARNPTAAYPLIGQKRASYKDAIAAAADRLEKSQTPLIGGLGTDIDGVRAAVALAEKSKGIIDHANSTGIDAGQRVLQSRGWFLTTLAEVRNRADLVVLVGADVNSQYANFLRRVVEPRQALQSQRRKKRRVVYLGTAAGAPRASKKIDIQTIEIAREELAESINIVRALRAGTTLSTIAPRGKSTKALGELAAAIEQAEYPVFVWAASQLNATSADLVILNTSLLVNDINQGGQRAAALSLGGDNGAINATNVCTWLTGFPLHISFIGKTIEYDPIRYKSARLIEQGQIDTLLWIDAFNEASVPTNSNGLARIVVANEANGVTDKDIFIPVGTPGLDHAARMMRTDSVVSLYLDGLRDRQLRDAGTVLRAITAAL